MAKLRWAGGTREVEDVPVLVGRDPVACDVAIEDDSLLSRVHFALVPGPDSTYLVDLRSSNGTFVNEARVHYSRLRDGDRIQAGSGQFQFEDEARPGQQLAILREPRLAFLARGTRDPFLGFLRRLQTERSPQGALEAATEGLLEAARAEEVPSPAAFALMLEGADPVGRAAAGAPASALAEILGPVLVRFRSVARPFLIERVRRDPGFLPEGYPIRVESVGSLAAAPLGISGERGLLCLATTDPNASLGAEHLIAVEAFALPLGMGLASLSMARLPG